MAGDAHHRPTVADMEANGNEVPTPPATGTAANGDAAPQTEGAKPNAGVTIVFKNMAGGEVSFKIKRNTKLKKAMDAYTERMDLNRLTLRFLFEGQRVLDENTADDVSCSLRFCLRVICLSEGGL